MRLGLSVVIVQPTEACEVLWPKRIDSLHGRMTMLQLSTSAKDQRAARGENICPVDPSRVFVSRRSDVLLLEMARCSKPIQAVARLLHAFEYLCDS